MDAKLVRICCGEDDQLIAVYSGLPLEEFVGVLNAVFPVCRRFQPIGLESFGEERSTVIPLTLVCSSPQILTASAYKLLLNSGNTDSIELSLPVHVEQFVGSLQEAGIVNQKEHDKILKLLRTSDPLILQVFANYELDGDQDNLIASLIAIVRDDTGEAEDAIDVQDFVDYDEEEEAQEGEEEDREEEEGGEEEEREEEEEEEGGEESEDYDGVSAHAIQELSSLAKAMTDRRILSSIEGRTLQQIIDQRHPLILVAFDIAAVDNDVDELQNLLLQIAQIKCRSRPLTREDQLLQALANMRQRTLISARQAAFLHDLVEHELVEAAFQAHEIDGDNEELYDTLVHIAQRVDSAISSTIAEATSSRPLTPTPAKDDFRDVVDELTETFGFTQSEHSRLCELISQEDQYVMAAFEVYENDGDMDELYDTLQRIIRLRRPQTTSTAPEDMKQESSKTAEQTKAPEFSRTLIPQSIDNLVKSKNLSPSEARILHELYSKENNVLDAAFEAYTYDQDLNELVDTVRRIVYHYVQAQKDHLDHKRRSHNTDDTEEPPAKRPTNTWSASRPQSAVSGDKPKQPQGIDEFVKLLVRQGLLLAHEAEAVIRLNARKDELVLAAFQVYAMTKDLDDFVDSIHRILRKNGVQTRANASNASNATSATSARQNDAAVTTSVSASQEDEDICQSFLQHVVKLMSEEQVISKAEAATLQTMTKQKNSIIMSAYEAYEVDEDAEDLIDTLTRIARHQTQSQHQSHTKVQSSYQTSSQVDDKENEEDLADGETAKSIMIQLVSEGSLPQSVALKLFPCAESQDDVLLAAIELYLADGDTEDLVDTLVRLAQKQTQQGTKYSSISDAFVHAVAELYAASDITRQQADVMISLYQKNEPMVHGACDTFEATQDWIDFKDTLRRICFLIQQDENVAQAAPQTQVRPTRQTESDRSTSNQDQTQHQRLIRDMKELIDSMAEMKKLSAKEAAILCALIDSENSVVLAAFDVFFEDLNVEELQDTLQRIVLLQQKHMLNSGDSKTQPLRGARVQPVDSSGNLPSERSHKSQTSSATQTTEVRPDEVNRLILKAVEDMSLSQEENAALRTRIEQGDVMIRAALEVFRIDADVDELKDTLTRIARRTVNSSQRETPQSISSARVTENIVNKATNVLYSKGLIDANQRSLLLQRSEDPILNAAAEVFHIDGDETELMDTVRRVAFFLSRQ